MALPAARTSLRAARLARSRQAASQSRVNPFRIHELTGGQAAEIPDIIEFVTSDKYLDRPIYPRQGTILKIVTLQDELFTQFDLDVIGEWEETFAQTGLDGISPNVLDRIRINKEQGRPWFRETDAAIGRRGGKGYVGALLGSYVLWNYMHRPGGPQEYYGIDRDKRLGGVVFGTRKEQARDNQWRDINNVILGGACFSPYISRPQNERLTIFAPTDILRAERQRSLGIRSDADLASFEFTPAASTTMAARGPATFSLYFDEQAHVVTSTSNADAGPVYDAATPSLDQFGKDGFIYAPSSTWAKTGKFYENCQLAIEQNPDGSPAYPERLLIQLASWGPYEDHEEASRIPMKPPNRVMVEVDVEVPTRKKMPDGKFKTRTLLEKREVEQLVPGPTFPAVKNPIQVYDDDMRQLERANPETFAVERRSRWAESLNAYLNAKKVDEMFTPWESPYGRLAEFTTVRYALNETYLAHGDPANSNKRFGWSMGHRVWVPKLNSEGQETRDGMWHVVFDRIRCWDPADYEDHILDYDDVIEDIQGDISVALPEEVSFDQFNVPATIGRLRKWVGNAGLPKEVVIREVTRTRPLNWKHAEIFKSALNMGLVHAPLFDQEIDPETGENKVNYPADQAKSELKFLEEKNGKVDHPTSGPVQTKDIADCAMEVVVGLIGKQMATFLGMEFEEVGLSGAAPMGTDPGRHSRTDTQTDPRQALGNLSGMSRRQTGQGGPARGMRRR